jgi:hypothetical protein
VGSDIMMEGRNGMCILPGWDESLDCFCVMIPGMKVELSVHMLLTMRRRQNFGRFPLRTVTLILCAILPEESPGLDLPFPRLKSSVTMHIGHPRR